MKISIFYRPEHEMTKFVDEEIEITNLSDLPKYICKLNWSPGTFKASYVNGIPKRHRTNPNLKEINLFVIDIDDGMTIDDAVRQTQKLGLNALIATTRHHQKEKITGTKVKPACDRFRVIIPLDRPLYSDTDFKHIWLCIQRHFPSIDPATKDSARFFFPCIEFVTILPGRPFQTVDASNTTGNNYNLSQGKKECLSRATLDFIEKGINGTETWHPRFFKAAMDIKEQGYSIEEATNFLSQASPEKKLDSEDLRQLRDVFEKRSARYPPRSVGYSYIKTPKCESTTKTARQYQSRTYEERKMEYEEDKHRREAALKNKSPFLCNAFNGIIWLTLGFYLIGARSGHGKSTVAANIVAYYLRYNPEKEVMVITNEESSEDVLSRVACVLLKQDWKAYREKLLPEETLVAVEKVIETLIPRIEVISAKAKQWDTTVLEDVQAILEYAGKQENRVGLAVIDYLQTVYSSRFDEKMAPFEVLKRFGNFLRTFGQSIALPIVVFAQMNDPSKGGDAAARIQNDRTIYNHAPIFIELVPDLKKNITTFIIHKDRWGGQTGTRVVTQFVAGHFENPTGFKNVGKENPISEGKATTQHSENPTPVSPSHVTEVNSIAIEAASMQAQAEYEANVERVVGHWMRGLTE